MLALNCLDCPPSWRLTLAGLFATVVSATPPAAGAAGQEPGPKQQSRGLHGYIGFESSHPEDLGEFGMGMGLYSAAWTLVDQPIAGFQIGLASTWILPDNRDNTTQPLAPEGTLARTWPERGPTWDSVFQTLEGGIGYWARSRFRYGPPKFSMNGTPQCYDYEVGSPGWSFFYDTEALPDNRLGIAQLSNRLLIPPDALPFAGNPQGEFVGYTYLALPFTDPTVKKLPGQRAGLPTGEQAWTCFLSTANFKGPIAYYIPETWSKIGELFNEPFLYGRGLDERPGLMNGGAMEVNTVPQLVGRDAQGQMYSKLPNLRFPVDEQGRAVLVQDVTYYSKKALYDAFLAWRQGGPAPTGKFDPAGAFVAKLTTRMPGFQQDDLPMEGVERAFHTQVFEDGTWGLVWKTDGPAPVGQFPQYYRHGEGRRVAVSPEEVPKETGLHTAEFELANPGEPFTSPNSGAWSKPGPERGPFEVQLCDGSKVTYSWYRFVDQPSFQQYDWSPAKKRELQKLVEALHGLWPIDQDYMPPPTHGRLVTLDPALIVTPPKGLEHGYVPIVTRQESAK